MELNRKFQFVCAILAFVGLLAPMGSGCTVCDLTNGAASACGTTSLFEHRHHGHESFSSHSPSPALGVSSKETAVHHHGKRTSPTTKTGRGDQVLSGTQSSCCHASNLLPLSIQATATPQNRRSPLSSALAVRVVGGPVVVHAASKPEAVSPPPISSDQAFLCAFLV